VPGKIVSKLITALALAILAAGATTLALKITSAPQAQSLAPAIMTTHLHQLQGELALP
jgi:hypothetical protein